jgi:hypothetical protein
VQGFISQFDIPQEQAAELAARAPISKELRDQAVRNLDNWKSDPVWREKIAKKESPYLQRFGAALALSTFPVFP